MGYSGPDPKGEVHAPSRRCAGECDRTPDAPRSNRFRRPAVPGTDLRSPSVPLPGSDFCGFDVQAEVEQKFKFIEFSGDRGTLWTAMTVGKLKAVLTNVETGESIAVNIPGPGFIDVDGNTIVGTGPWLVFVPGQLLFLVGHITFEPGPFGVQPTVVRGRSFDLCDALAPD